MQPSELPDQQTKAFLFYVHYDLLILLDSSFRQFSFLLKYLFLGSAFTSQFFYRKLNLCTIITMQKNWRSHQSEFSRNQYNSSVQQLLSFEKKVHKFYAHRIHHLMTQKQRAPRNQYFVGKRILLLSGFHQPTCHRNELIVLVNVNQSMTVTTESDL